MRKNDKEPNALREIRQLFDMTQARIAKEVGISRSLWSALENRQRPLTVALLNKMKRVLGLTEENVKDILDWWGESHLSDGKAA